jgi:ubiquinone/menaquinone biosynthesis C-methylase UbiE
MATLTSALEYYDRIAPCYEAFFRDFRASIEEERRWLAQYVPPGSRVLDSCCGTGRQAIPLALGGHGVMAMDPSGQMLQRARCLARELGCEIRFRRGGFADLPRLPTRSFDCVLALGNGLCHAPSTPAIQQALSAMARLCSRDLGICIVGIKDFDAILASRPTVHVMGSQSSGRGRVIQTWEYSSHRLLVTTHVLIDDGEGESFTVAETMVREDELRAMATVAGFRSVVRLACDSEARYLLSV